MPLKPKIYKAVPATNVVDRCVSELASCIDLKKLGDEIYTVVCYPGMRNESSSIVDSRNIEKVLSKVSSEPYRVVAIAHNFTEEAKQLLEARDAVYFFSSDFYWSDASWAKIRNSR